MAAEIEYPSNYSDLSNDRGFQFEFHCARCGSGLRTRFNPWMAGTASSILDAASSLFGGVFNSAADIGQRVRSAAWQSAHDEAFKAAIQEILPEFAQCPRCSTWVCRKQCWNERRGLCKNCAPDMNVERSAAQASRSREEAWAQAQVADEDKTAPDIWKETVQASCPQCEAPLDSNAKFCPECGAKIGVKKHCTQCGATLAAGARFCAECGAKVADSGGTASPSDARRSGGNKGRAG